MIEIIENSLIGNYYLKILPYVDEMSVSIDTNFNVFSLECDQTYNPDNKVGNFTGYPGKFDLEGKLNVGIANSTGLIYISKTEFYEVFDGIIVKGDHNKFNEFIEKNNEKYLNYEPNQIKAECTPIQTNINKHSELFIHLNFDTNSGDNKKSYGIFTGTPGEYYQDEHMIRYNRRYGNEYSSGTIVLTGPYNFKYSYDKGQISRIDFLNENIYSWKRLCSLDL